MSYPEPVYTGLSSVHWNATGMSLVDPVNTGIPLGDLEHQWRNYSSPHTQAHIVKQSSIHASLKWQAESGQVFVNSAFTWNLLHLKAYQLCSSNVWVLQHHFVHALDMSIHYFVYLGLQYKLNQLSSNNSRHTSCIHKGSHAGKWPDLVTSKPHALSTLRYHWTDCTGTTLADAIAQLSSSGNPVLICIIGTRWKTTGATSTQGCHWNHTS